MSKTTMPVGELVAERPERALVFEQYGIDYCCGGKVSLEKACAAKGVDVQDIVRRLDESDSASAGNTEPDWTKTTLRELVDHIICTYHEPLRKELPRIYQMARKVATVHGENHPEMKKLAVIFTRFRTELELHMQKEEFILFPGIIQIEQDGNSTAYVGCGTGIQHPIDVMMQEHDSAGEAIAEMRKLTNNYEPPADACNTFKVLLYALAQLESEMHRHVHKENNILFPRALSVGAPRTACC
jgi:regulator of cell morphogenesis and NO signaling